MLVESNVVPTLLACLSHENVDVAADAVELIMELTAAGGCLGLELKGGLGAQLCPFCWSACHPNVGLELIIKLCLCRKCVVR